MHKLNPDEFKAHEGCLEIEVNERRCCAVIKPKDENSLNVYNSNDLLIEKLADKVNEIIDFLKQDID